MSTSVFSATSNDSGATSVGSVQMTLPDNLLDGDYLVNIVTAERATAIPNVPTGLENPFTVLTNTAGTAESWFMGRVPVGPNDSLVTIVSTIPPGDGSVVRRQAIGCIIVRGSDAPNIVTAVGTYTANADGVLTATAPSVTPSADDCLLVSIMASCSNVAPFSRTKTADSPYTLDFFDQSTSGTSTNAEVVCAHRQLTGGKGVSQAGCTFRDSSTKFHWIAATLAIPPSLNAPVAIFVPSVVPAQANMRSVW